MKPCDRLIVLSGALVLPTLTLIVALTAARMALEGRTLQNELPGHERHMQGTRSSCAGRVARGTAGNYRGPGQTAASIVGTVFLVFVWFAIIAQIKCK